MIGEKLVDYRPNVLRRKARLSPFHGSNRGSNPRGDAIHEIHKLDKYPEISRLKPRSLKEIQEHQKTLKDTLPHRPSGGKLVNSKK